MRIEQWDRPEWNVAPATPREVTAIVPLPPTEVVAKHEFCQKAMRTCTEMRCLQNGCQCQAVGSNLQRLWSLCLQSGMQPFILFLPDVL